MGPSSGMIQPGKCVDGPSAAVPPRRLGPKWAVRVNCKVDHAGDGGRSVLLPRLRPPTHLANALMILGRCSGVVPWLGAKWGPVTNPLHPLGPETFLMPRRPCCSNGESPSRDPGVSLVTACEVALEAPTLLHVVTEGAGTLLREDLWEHSAVSVNPWGDPDGRAGPLAGFS